MGGDTHLFCLPMNKYSKTCQFFLTTAAVFGFFIIYGYFLELIFRLDGISSYGWFLTLVQFLYYVLFGAVEKLCSGWNTPRKIPVQEYLLLALLTVATMGLSNAAVGYLNYPTQVIFKSCKLIPVLLGGVIIQGKTFSAKDILACCCMSVGLIFFTLADSEVSPNFNPHGVLIICGALLADAVIGNMQEKAFKKHGASNAEMILWSYTIGSVYILVGLLVNDQFYPAVRFCSQYPLETYGYGAIFSLTGYLGVTAVLVQVKLFGALTAVTVTTCRKAVTIILSFVIFSKPFSVRYLYSGLVVVLGIYLNTCSKEKDLTELLMACLLRRSRAGAQRVDLVV